MGTRQKETAFFGKVAARIAAGLLLAALAAFPALAYAAGPDAEECVELARRQSALFEAEARSDWKAIYSFVLPGQRKKVSLRDFAGNPYAMPINKTVSLSGAKSALEPGAEPELKTRYLPEVVGYRFVEFRISPGGNDAVVISDVRAPMPIMMGSSVGNIGVSDYWHKEGGEWYLDLYKRFTVHASGAITRVSPESDPTLTAKADWLAKQFLDAALKLPEGSAERERALDEALWLDTFGVVKRIAVEKIPAGGLPLAHVKRALAAYPNYRNYFEPMMDMGYWYGLVGDYESSYDGYLSAHVVYQASEGATAATAKAAVALERWAEATALYIDLLGIVPISGQQVDAGLEPYIQGECSLCQKVPVKTLRTLAAALVRAGRADLAASIYGNVLEAGLDWKDITGRLVRGKGVTIKELLAPEFSGTTAQMTYAEIAELLKAPKIGLYHPDDAPAGLALGNKTFSAQSVPKLNREDFAGGHSSNTIPPSATIAWGNGKAEFSAPDVGGYAAVFINKAGVAGKSYRDNARDSAENYRLANAIDALKKGAGVILARASMLPQKVDARTEKMLNAIGVDTKALAGGIPSLVVFGVKGSKPGTALVFHGDGAIRKTFLPSNMGAMKSSKGAAITISGLRENDTVRFRK